MPGQARKLWTIGISGMTVLALAGCGTTSAPQKTAQKAPAARHSAPARAESALHLHGKLISPPVHINPGRKKVVIHPRLISPPVQLLPKSTGNLHWLDPPVSPQG